MDGTLGETLTAGSFAGDGATLYLDADGSTNTGNDHLYVTGSHTGTTALHLRSTSNTWEGALGTVLASVGDEEGAFVSDAETEAALHYYDLKLDSKTDNVTDGYSTDWYLKGFTKAPTNDEGHHTTVGRNLGGITGGNYLLWRSDMDTLFRRMGEADGSLTDNTDNGIWARGKGKKFSRESDFLVDSKFNEYEVGYDWLHKKTETKEHVIGVGFAYLDGDATYVSGKGDLKGYTLGLYDTQVWKNGQYLDTGSTLASASKGHGMKMNLVIPVLADSLTVSRTVRAFPSEPNMATRKRTKRAGLWSRRPRLSWDTSGTMPSPIRTGCTWKAKA